VPTDPHHPDDRPHGRPPSPPRRHRPRRRWAPAVAVVLAGALVGAACGDDDDDAATTDDTALAADDAAADGASSDADADAYCAASLAIETAGEPDIDFETATDEEIAAAAMTFANETMQPLVDDVLATVPAELSADADILAGALAEIGETGDYAAFEAPEVVAAGERVHAYDLEACGWDTVDAVATEYAFSGIPEQVDAGVVSFELANDGTEVHEVLVLRKNDGVTASFEELLALPEEEAQQNVTFVGVGGPVPAGEGAYLVADLEAGEYVAVCFIPTGMTAMDGPPPEGPPHAMSGMSHEFTVS
jgi:hypothetical protein